MAAVALGDPAPELDLRDQHGRVQRLADRRGARNTLIVFYPFAFTGVCTVELQALRDCSAEWSARGTDVLAVSCDTVASLRRFAEDQAFDFPLLSDFWPHGAVCRAYDVFDEGLGAASRGTFLVDRDGVVRWTVRTGIADAREVSAYLAALDAL